MPNRTFYENHLNNPNVQAFLKVIMIGETDDLYKYDIITRGNPIRPPYSFKLFNGVQHPKIFKEIRGGQPSSAAGAYQMTYTTFNEIKNNYGLTDFNKKNQDLACVIRIGYNQSALQDVINGNIASAFRKLNQVWTSFPGGVDQRFSIQEGLTRFVNYGGSLSLVDETNLLNENSFNGTNVSYTDTPNSEPIIKQIDFSTIANNITAQELDDTEVGWGSRSNIKEESDFIGLKQYILYLITRYYPNTLIPFVELIPHFDIQDLRNIKDMSDSDKKTAVMNAFKKGGAAGFYANIQNEVTGGDKIIDNARFNRTVERLNQLNNEGGVDLHVIDPFREFSDEFNVPNESSKTFESKRGLTYKIFGNLDLTPNAEQDSLSKPGGIGLQSISIEQGAQSQNGMTLITVKMLDVLGNKLLDPNSPWSFILNLRADGNNPGGGDFYFRFGWQISIPKYEPNGNYSKDIQAGKFWNHQGWKTLFRARAGENDNDFDSGHAIKSYIYSLAKEQDGVLTFTQNVSEGSIKNAGFISNKAEDGKISYKIVRNPNVFDYLNLTLITPEINVNPKDGSIEATLVFRTTPAVANCLCPIFGPSLKGKYFATKALVSKSNVTLEELMSAFVADNYHFNIETKGDEQIKREYFYYKNNDISNWLTVIGGVGTETQLHINPSDIKVTFSSDQQNEITNATSKDSRLLIDWLSGVLATNNMALLVAADKNTGGSQLDKGFMIAFDNDKAGQLTGESKSNLELAKDDITFGDFLKMVEVSNNNSLSWIGSRLYTQDDVFSFRFQGSLIEEINVEKLNAPNQSTMLAHQQYANTEGESGDIKEVERRGANYDNGGINRTTPKVTLADKKRNLNMIYSEMLGLHVKAICHPWLKIARPCYVKGMGFWDGKYTILKLTHELDTSGKFVTNISANRIPDANVIATKQRMTYNIQDASMRNPNIYMASNFVINTPKGALFKSTAPVNSLPNNIKENTSGLVLSEQFNNLNNIIFKTPLLRPELESYVTKLHHSYQNHFRNFLREVEEKYIVRINSGYRTFAEQLREYNLNSLNARPGYSMHNYGLSIDINCTNRITGKVLLKSTSENETDNWLPIVSIANKYGLTWGGTFNGYPDRVHFGLDRTFNIDVLLYLATKQFGTNPIDIHGNRINLKK